MARRELLNDDERQRLFGLPESEAELIRHYTLTPADLQLAADRHGARAVGGGLYRWLSEEPSALVTGTETRTRVQTGTGADTIGSSCWIQRPGGLRGRTHLAQRGLLGN